MGLGYIQYQRCIERSHPAYGSCHEVMKPSRSICDALWAKPFGHWWGVLKWNLLQFSTQKNHGLQGSIWRQGDDNLRMSSPWGLKDYVPSILNGYGLRSPFRLEGILYTADTLRMGQDRSSGWNFKRILVCSSWLWQKWCDPLTVMIFVQWFFLHITPFLVG